MPLHIQRKSIKGIGLPLCHKCDRCWLHYEWPHSHEINRHIFVTKNSSRWVSDLLSPVSSRFLDDATEKILMNSSRARSAVTLIPPHGFPVTWPSVMTTAKRLALGLDGERTSCWVMLVMARQCTCPCPGNLFLGAYRWTHFYWWWHWWSHAAGRSEGLLQTSWSELSLCS